MSGNSGWDVVFPSAEFIQPMREMGLLQPLDHALLPNLDSLDAAFQHPPWDPELRWNVPYMHGTTGIVYQLGIAPEPKAWADLWDTRLSGKITMLDDPPEVFAACLKKIGDSLNSGAAGELRNAEREAIAQKRLLRAYLNAEVRDQVVAGDVAAAQAWAVTAGQAMAGGAGEAGIRAAGGRICAIRGHDRDSAGEPARGAGARVHQLFAAAAKWPRRSWRRRRRLPRMRRRRSCCRRLCARIRYCIRRRRFWRAANGLSRSPRRAQKLRDRLWTEIKSA